MDKVAKETSAPTSGNITSNISGTFTSEVKHSEGRKFLNQAKKKTADSTMDHALSSKKVNGATLVGQTEPKDSYNEQHSKVPTERVIDASGHIDSPRPKNDSRCLSDSQSERRLNHVDGLVQPIKHKKKSDISGLKETRASEGKHAQASNTHQVHKRDGSNVKTKAIMLEKAIKELEKMVAESRPPAMEVPDADMSGQAVKRRLPQEIKQKLAKVARLAQANYGEVSEEVVNRLMGFLGHTMQLRTLKRNLRMMISSGLSAKQEKEVWFQQIKK